MGEEKDKDAVEEERTSKLTEDEEGQDNPALDMDEEEVNISKL